MTCCGIKQGSRPFFWISNEWCLNYLFSLLISRARFITLWKRNGLWELVNETMPSLVSENEKLFVCGVPFQFVGSADFEWELCFIQYRINLRSRAETQTKLSISSIYTTLDRQASRTHDRSRGHITFTYLWALFSLDHYLSWCELN